MANLNKVMLIGRLTRDPEITEFSNGGKVANISFAVNKPRKNQETGKWEEVPVWVSLKAFNHETGRKMADVAEQHLRKGQQAYIEGHLVLEEWAGKEDGKKHSKMLVYVDGIEFLGGGKSATGASREPAKAFGKSAPAREEAMEDAPF